MSDPQHARTFELCAATTVFRPAAQVWAVLADYANDPRWRTGVVAMTADPPGISTAATRTTEELRFAGRTWRTRGEVGTVVPGTRLTWRTVSGADADGARTVTALAPGRCAVRLDLRVRPHGLQRLFGSLLARMLQHNLTRDVEALRELVEATPSRSADERTSGSQVSGPV
ncbi:MULTISPECIES: SRPBCC family protein [unclassified Nocardia]|uniref:SRPBCC family protein n=1 Tax=unclassified Nocardia TaxID=2637762 RepID=UPI0033A3FC6A